MASSAPSTPEELIAVLDPVLAQAGLVLDGLTVTPAGRRRVVRVAVDLPDDAVGSVPEDRVVEASRAVSTVLDEVDAFGTQPYLLEVGSPGVGRPLTEPRHWRRARTRLVVVDVTPAGDGGPRGVTGRVVEADADGVVLLVDGERLPVPWDRLGKGAVQVEFRRPDVAGAHDEQADDEQADDEQADDGGADDAGADDDGADDEDEEDGR